MFSLRSAYDLRPEYPPVSDTYADVLARNGRGARALAVIDKTIRTAHGDPLYKLRRVEIMDLTGERERAIEVLRALSVTDVPPCARQRAQALLHSWGG